MFYIPCLNPQRHVKGVNVKINDVYAHIDYSNLLIMHNLMHPTLSANRHSQFPNLF